MTCRELVSLLEAELGGELDREIRGRFESHLRECAQCLAYLRSYRETRELVRRSRSRERAPSTELSGEIVRAILAARRDPRRRPQKS